MDGWIGDEVRTRVWFQLTGNMCDIVNFKCSWCTPSKKWPKKTDVVPSNWYFNMYTNKNMCVMTCVFGHVYLNFKR